MDHPNDEISEVATEGQEAELPEDGIKTSEEMAGDSHNITKKEAKSTEEDIDHEEESNRRAEKIRNGLEEMAVQEKANLRKACELGKKGSLQKDYCQANKMPWIKWFKVLNYHLSVPELIS